LGRPYGAQRKLDEVGHGFDELSERRFQLVAKLESEKLPGDLQDAEYLFMTSFQFREEFLPLQLKYHLFVGGQDRAYSFRNARNREDAAQSLRRFVHWEVSRKEIFLRRFAVLAPRASQYDQNHIGFFSKNINICIRHYWLNRYQLWSSTTG
jgi:hypothetical protein